MRGSISCRRDNQKWGWCARACPQSPFGKHDAFDNAHVQERDGAAQGGKQRPARHADGQAVARAPCRRVPPTCSPSHRHLGLPRLSRRETPQSDAPPARSKHPHLRAEPGLQRRTASSSLRHATCAAQGGTHAAAFLALLLGPAGCTWRRRLVKGVELPRRL